MKRAESSNCLGIFKTNIPSLLEAVPIIVPFIATVAKGRTFSVMASEIVPDINRSCEQTKTDVPIPSRKVRTRILKYTILYNLLSPNEKGYLVRL